MVHRNRCAIESRTEKDAEVENYNAIMWRMKMTMESHLLSMRSQV